MNTLIIDNQDFIVDFIKTKTVNIIPLAQIRCLNLSSESNFELNAFAPELIIIELKNNNKHIGLNICKTAKQLQHSVRIIAIAEAFTAFTLKELTQIEVEAYIVKDKLINDYETALRGCVQGFHFFSNALNSLISQYFSKCNGSYCCTKLPELTDRQAEYLPHFTEGLTDEEIARKFHITVGAVNKMRKELYQKFKIEGSGKLKIVQFINKVKGLGYIE